MGNILNEDFTDFLNALNEKNVEYVLVGGYAVIFHGYNRTTGDLDIWVNPTSENYFRLLKAFDKFGLPVFDMSEEKFLKTAEYDVFTFGRPPVSIDVITKATGLVFSEVFAKSAIQNFDGVYVRMIDIRDLITGKKSVNRPKDQDDVDHLQ
jgi:predicted nucleotidyltransferase